jgi:hypothetical protein
VPGQNSRTGHRHAFRRLTAERSAVGPRTAPRRATGEPQHGRHPRIAVVSSMLSSASRVRYQDWLGRILAGSIGLYALALAQSLAPRFGYSSLATVVLAAASGTEVEPA